MGIRVKDMNPEQYAKYKERLRKKREQYALGRPLTAEKVLKAKKQIEQKVDEGEQPWLSKRGDVYSVETMHIFHLVNAYNDKIKNKPEGWEEVVAIIRAELRRRNKEYMIGE